MRFSILSVSVVLFGWSVAQASVFKGQRAYMKECRSCHGSCKMTGTHTRSEWNIFFSNDGAKLVQLHLKDPAALKLFNSGDFQKSLKHLRQFFEEYAGDTGNVAACE